MVDNIFFTSFVQFLFLSKILTFLQQELKQEYSRQFKNYTTGPNYLYPT